MVSWVLDMRSGWGRGAFGFLLLPRLRCNHCDIIVHGKLRLRACVTSQGLPRMPHIINSDTYGICILFRCDAFWGVLYIHLIHWYYFEGASCFNLGSRSGCNLCLYRAWVSSSSLWLPRVFTPVIALDSGSVGVVCLPWFERTVYLTKLKKYEFYSVYVLCILSDVMS